MEQISSLNDQNLLVRADIDTWKGPSLKFFNFMFSQSSKTLHYEILKASKVHQNNFWIKDKKGKRFFISWNKCVLEHNFGTCFPILIFQLFFFFFLGWVLQFFTSRTSSKKSRHQKFPQKNKTRIGNHANKLSHHRSAPLNCPCFVPLSLVCYEYQLFFYFLQVRRK